MLSKEWDNASRPVEIVKFFGLLIINLGSITDISGYKDLSANENLLLYSLSQTVAQHVSSLDVPEVVGIAIIFFGSCT